MTANMENQEDDKAVVDHPEPPVGWVVVTKGRVVSAEGRAWAAGELDSKIYFKGAWKRARTAVAAETDGPDEDASEESAEEPVSAV